MTQPLWALWGWDIKLIVSQGSAERCLKTIRIAGRVIAGEISPV
jgi:hypothetical protein